MNIDDYLGYIRIVTKDHPLDHPFSIRHLYVGHPKQDDKDYGGWDFYSYLSDKDIIVGIHTVITEIALAKLTEETVKRIGEDLVGAFEKYTKGERDLKLRGGEISREGIIANAKRP